MIKEYLKKLYAQELLDIICVGSVEIDNSHAEITTSHTCIYIELDFGYVKLDSVDQYSKLRLSFAREIENNIELEEGEFFTKYSIANIVLKDFLAENIMKSVGVYNANYIPPSTLECDALEIKLENGQLIFVDPSYFGIQIGGEEIKYRWMETISLTGKELNFVCESSEH